jgi:hypothetical protein
MADACDRVRALFASAIDEDAVRAMAPELEQMMATEPSTDARHVFAGAIARLRQAIEPASAHDDDDDDDDDDDEDDDELLEREA